MPIKVLPDGHLVSVPSGLTIDLSKLSRGKDAWQRFGDVAYATYSNTDQHDPMKEKTRALFSLARLLERLMGHE